MSNRLKWVKPLIQNGRHFHTPPRLSRYYDGECRFRSLSYRMSRRATTEDGSQNHLQNGSSLEKVVPILRDRVYKGIAVDSYDYVHVLQRCSKHRDLETVKQVHDCIKKSQMEQHPYVANNLLKSYIACGNLQTAKEIFNKLLKKDTVTWTIMIGGYVENCQPEGAIEMYKQMRNEGAQPNAITYLSALKACTGPTALKWGKEIHAHILSDELRADLRISTALVLMYANCGSIKDARKVFRRMEVPDIISWTVMIGGLAQHGLGQEAFSLFLQMQREGFMPNVITYLSILNPGSSKGALHWVKEVHAHATKAGLDVDMRVGNALINMYAKIGMIADARQVFESMLSRNVISWTAMIGGLGQHGHGREALQLCEEMKSKGIEPSSTLFVAVLSACSHAGLVDEGRLLFESFRRDHAIDPALEHYNCMVDILGRAGHLEEAKFFIAQMPVEPDIVTWRALLGACVTHKNLELAELAARECLKLEPTDPCPYVLLSNVYAAVGDRDKVSLIRSRMHKGGICKDPGLCWIEVENQVHHFLVGDTSHPETREIYAMLSDLSKKLKTEGYSPDARLVLWNIDEENGGSALCSLHSEKLAIAYGLIHVPPGEPIRIYKNVRICTDCHTATKLVSKVTGRDIVARDAIRFHHFKDGSCSCADYW